MTQATKECSDLFQANSLCGKPAGRVVRAANEEPTVTFTVGAQNPSDCRNDAFCNGPLQAGTDYFVKVRAFTGPGQYEDTAYSSKVTTGGALLLYLPSSQKVKIFQSET